MYYAVFNMLESEMRYKLRKPINNLSIKSVNLVGIFYDAILSLI